MSKKPKSKPKVVQDKPRFMVRSGPQRLRWDKELHRWVPKAFTEDEEHGYTSNFSRSLDGVETIPPEVQERYSLEARERHESFTTLPERVQKLIETIDDPRRLRSLETRIERLERVSRKAA